jgi:hypothetical protein
VDLCALLVVLLSKAFFQSLPCLREVHDAIAKGLVIIPVRVEESGSTVIDIARDMESMWPDEIIVKYVSSVTKNNITYSKKLKQTRLQRFNVKNELSNANTLPARGSRLTESNVICDATLAELTGRTQDILNDEHPSP